ncbi:hypothetical protein [Pseudomonas sp. LA5]|uniref:hypothetical protein n=1 Tax=Pseudomonas sp. LA5 TaxID=3027850 RepID=UPI00235F44B2|nr:hypothetical protein [Pseudomonas sp. LA5]
MASSKKPKVVHYKNAIITGQPNLQALLEGAMGNNGPVKRPNQRQQKANAEDTVVIFINKFQKYNGMNFGQLVYLEKGRKQPFITVDDDAEFYSIDSLSSDDIPDTEVLSPDIQDPGVDSTTVKKRREFVESILYFGVLDNHLVLMQSAALQSRHLEAHLTWLLTSCTSSLQTGVLLSLSDKPAESVFEKLKKAPAKSIHVGAPLTTEPAIDPSHPNAQGARLGGKGQPVEEVHASKVRFEPTGVAAAIIKAVAPGLLDRLNLEESLDEANIHLALEITYNRKTTKTGQEVIDSIATSLRHSPASDVVINLQGGGKIYGDELKLSGNISVDFLPSGLINESTLYHEMHRWLSSKIESSEIDATSESTE